MAELADALDLGSSSERSTGSIPARCTNILKLPPFIGPSGTMMNGGFIYDSKSQHNLDKSQ